MESQFWIEKRCGSIENVTIEDVDAANQEAIFSDDVKSSFWIGHNDQEFVLRISSSLDFAFIYGKN
ncbi:hypothetical protein [Flavobacterium sp.]|uniref:hypothetical protein n=1 Tax=Flavobacterium sp. TaxID=239 RepID=UPI0031D192A7